MINTSTHSYGQDLNKILRWIRLLKGSILLKLVVWVVFFIAQPIASYGQTQSGEFTDSRDGQSYRWVTIGQQTWMGENLNVGTRIDSTIDATNNATIEKYCYRDDTLNCREYGGLYQWDEMMQYQPSDTGNPGSVQGVCPEGWHVPTHKEWSELAQYISDEMGPYQFDGSKWEGVGLHLKDSLRWDNGDNGTDDYGFAALPSGFRMPDSGKYVTLGSASYQWAASEMDSTSGYTRRMMGWDDLEIMGLDKNDGAAVRCIRNTTYLYSAAIDLSSDSINFGTLTTRTDVDTFALKLTNQGSAEMVVDSMEIPEVPFGVVANTAPDTLAAGDSLKLDVTINKDTSAGTYKDSLWLYTNAGDTCVPVISQLEAPSPELVMNKDSINFEKLTNGAFIDTASIQLYNHGELDMIVDSIISPAGPFNSTSYTVPDTIVPDDSLKLWVTFNRDNSAGTYQDSLSIYTNDKDTTVAIEGQLINPAISFSNDGVDFGTLLSNDQKDTASFYLYSSGTTNLILDSLASLQSPFKSENLSRPDTIVPGDSLNLQAIFNHDTTAGTYLDTMDLYTNAGDTILPLKASLINPEVGLTPASIDFGTSVPDTLPETTTFGLFNSGTTDLIISSLQIAQAPFSLEGLSAPDTLAPEDTLSVNVSFNRDTTVNTYRDSIILSTNEGDTTIPMWARLSATSLGITTDSISFGILPTDTIASTAGLVITNYGENDLILDSLNKPHLPFGIEDISTPYTLTPDDTLSLTPTFHRDTALGSYQDTLSLYTSDVDTTVSLKGSLIASALELSADSVGFGTVHRDTVADTTAIDLVNNATRPVIIDSLSLPQAPFNTLDLSAPDTLGATDTLSVTVSFNRDTPADGYYDTLSIYTSDIDTTVFIEGHIINPAVSISPDSIDFDTLQVDTTGSAASFYFYNTGTTNLILDSLETPGKPYSLEGLTAPDTLAPGDSLKPAITFNQDTLAGNYNDSIFLYTNDRDTSMPMAAHLINPVIELTQDSIGFGSFHTDSLADATAFYLYNSGTTELILDSLYMPQSPFLMEGLVAPDTLLPNDTLALQATFSRDTTAGWYSDSLEIYSNDSHAVLPLTGQLINPELNIPSDSFDFGVVLKRAATDTASFNIYNYGTTELTLDSISMPQLPFGVADFTAPDTIIPDDTLALDMTFDRDTTHGIYNDSLVLFTNHRDTTVWIGGEVINPQITLSPDTVDFGSLPADRQKDTISYFISNNGSTDLTIDSVQSPQLPFVAAGIMTPDTLTPGDTLSLDMILDSDTSATSYRDSVKFFTNKRDTAIVLGASLLTLPAIETSLYSDTLDFDRQNMNTGDTTRQFNLINTGEADLVVDSIQKPDAPFTWNYSVPDTVHGNDTLQLSVTFSTDTLVGSYSDSALIYTNGPDSTIYLQADLPLDQPSRQASQLTVDRPWKDSLDISWSRGNGQYNAVFMARGDSGKAQPLDSTTYAADSTFGQGGQIGSSGWYCVYNGTDSSTVVKGISLREHYRLVVYEYNGPAGSVHYNTTDTTGNINDHHHLFTETGDSLTGVSGSMKWGDYNNDGDLDILLSGYDGSSQITKIYKNNGDGTFSEQTGISLAGVSSGSVDWGDYNNDGDLDILLSGYDGSNRITKIYSNNGDGTFSEQTGISLTGVYNCSLDWGDYDNDGDLDILLSGRHDQIDNPITRIYQNNGDGTFNEQVNISLTGVKASSVQWVDYDNDGDLDISISGSDGSNNMITKIYQNHGDGTFSEQTNVTLTGVMSSSIHWGDYDNDGDLDILLCGDDNNYNPITKIYRNNGDGDFSEQPGTSIADVEGSVEWGDYDNDGDLDILLSGDGGSRITKIYSNNGDGTFSEQTGISLPGVSNGLIDWGDYDSDGDLDILFTGYREGSRITRIYQNQTSTSNTTPEAPTNLSVSLEASRATLQWDKATDNETPQDGLSYNIYMYKKGGDTIVPPMSLSDGSRLIPEMGNVQKNTSWHIDDLSPGTYYWSVQAVDHAYAGSEFAAENTFTIESPYTSQTAINITDLTDVETSWCDVDNDQDVDILLTGYDGSALVSTLYRNKGDGTFNGESPAITGVRYGASAWGDYDGDQDRDLLITGYDGSSAVTKLYSNDGSGQFTEETDVSFVAVQQGDVEWMDYDNDADLDLLVTGNDGSNPVTKLYRNDTSGFTEITGISFADVQYSDAQWADVNNDGYADLLLTGNNGSSPISKLYLNDRGRGFSEVANVPFMGVDSSSVAFLDYNQDGLKDVILAGSDSSHQSTTKLYKNEGKGRFSEVRPVPFLNVKNGMVSVNDYNNDGLKDVLVTGHTGDTVMSRLYCNKGKGDFLTVVAGIQGLTHSSLIWKDYNNDGYADILSAGMDANANPYSMLYKNELAPSVYQENQQPSAPDELSADVSGYGKQAVLNWNDGSDRETPDQGLAYNIKLGRSSDSMRLFYPMADSAGYLKSSVEGNSGQDSFHLVNGLPAGTYYWTVQSIDQSGVGSAFATTDSFKLVNKAWHVDTSGSDVTGNGSETSPFRTIQQAIDTAGRNDTVLVHRGTYNENIDFKGKDLFVTSQYQITPNDSYVTQTVISSRNDSLPAVRISGVEKVEFQGFTVTNSQASGIVCDTNTIVNLKHLVVEGNSGINGAGISSLSDSLVVRNVTLRGNDASADGGGIWCKNVDSLSIGDLTLKNNTAVNGAGFYCDSARGNMMDVQASGNVASQDGGAFWTRNADLELGNIALNNNQGSRNGGGIYSDSTSLYMNHVHMEGNSASNDGGAMFIRQTALTLDHSEIIDNKAGRLGGGVYASGQAINKMNDLLIHGNQANQGGGLYLLRTDGTLKNLKLIDNTTDQQGGACFFRASSPILINPLVTNNAAAKAAGFYADSLANPVIANATIAGNKGIEGGNIMSLHQSHPELINSILWDNQPREIDLGTADTAGISVSYSDVDMGLNGIDYNAYDTVNYASNNIWEEPVFQDTANGNYELETGSPCIDQGHDIYKSMLESFNRYNPDAFLNPGEAFDQDSSSYASRNYSGHNGIERNWEFGAKFGVRKHIDKVNYKFYGYARSENDGNHLAEIIVEIQTYDGANWTTDTTLYDYSESDYGGSNEISTRQDHSYHLDAKVNGVRIHFYMRSANGSASDEIGEIIARVHGLGFFSNHYGVNQYDLKGNPRVVNGQIDLGAYEKIKDIQQDTTGRFLHNTGGKSLLGDVDNDGQVNLVQNLPGSKISADSLEAFYPFEASFSDSTANGHDATPSGVTFVEGHLGKPESAGFFERKNEDHLEVPHSSKLQPELGSESFSVGVWVKTLDNSQSYNRSSGVVSKIGGTFTNAWGMFVSADGNDMWYSIEDDQGDNHGYSVRSNIREGRWQHAVAVYNGEHKELKLYINGQLRDDTVAANFEGISNTSPLYIGRFDRYDENRDFNGSIDQVRIYRRALPPQEIRSLYHQGKYLVYDQANARADTLDMKWLSNSSVHWLDYNQDNNLDILVTGLDSMNQPKSMIYRNDGSGAFTLADSSMFRGLNYTSSAMGDYDNDGDRDLVLMGSDGNAPFTMLYVHQDSSYRLDEQAQLEDLAFGDALWADFDRDGDLDLVISGNDGTAPQTLFYQNTGNGNLSQQAVPAVAPVDSGALACDDYNNDGYPDLFVSGHNGNQNVARLYQNTGNWNFTEQVSFEGLVHGSADFGDYNSDGYPDLLMAGEALDSTVTRLYLNQKDGTFSQPPTKLPGVSQGSVHFWDYDGDQDLDFYLSGTSKDSSFTCLFRNNINVSNQPPDPPEHVQSEVQDSALVISWSPARDQETPAGGLTYNLALYDADDQMLIAPLADLESGRGRIRTGGPIQDTSWTVKGLPSGNYKVQLQSVDQSDRRSAFSQKNLLTLDYQPPQVHQPHPAEGAITSQIPEKITLAYQEPNPLETATLRATLNDTSLHASSQSLMVTDTSIILKTSTLQNMLVEGTNQVAFDSIADVYGNTAAENWSFVYDTTQPAITYYSPEDRGSIRDSLPEVALQLKDELSELDTASLRFHLDGQVYSCSSDALSFSRDTLIFSAAKAGEVFEEGDTARFELHASDKVDYGQPNALHFIWRGYVSLKGAFRLQVYDYNQALDSALVELVDEGEVVQQYWSNEQGEVMDSMVYGNYDFNVRKPGYFNRYIHGLEVEADQTIRAETTIGMIGDYDLNGQLDYEDVDDLVLAWNHQDPVIEIGPASGKLPDMMVHPDHVVDFEDLMVFAQVWNFRNAGKAHSPSLFFDQSNVGPAGMALIPHEQGDSEDTLHYGVWLKQTRNYRSSRLVVDYPAESLHLENISRGKYLTQADGGSILLTRHNRQEGRIELDLAKTGNSSPLHKKVKLASLTFGKKAGDREKPLTYSYEVRENNGRVSKGHEKTDDGVKHLSKSGPRVTGNYPNPFTDNTVIEFELPEHSRVRIQVYDSHGRKVAQLVDRPLNAGKHRITWQAKGLGSGVYYYRFNAGEYQSIHKCVKIGR